MAAFKSIGPARIYKGDFASVSKNVYQVVDVEDVTVSLGIRNAYTSNAELNGTPTKDGIYVLASKPVVEIQAQDMSVDQLNQLLEGVTKTISGSNEGIGFGDKFAQIPAASVPSLFILPVSQVDDGVGAANGIWLPGYTLGGLDGINFGRVDEGEILNPFNFTADGVYCATDQAGNTIPEGIRTGWMGPPATFGLSSWALS